MKLVIRPKPHRIESLRGYLLRLSEENGYPSPSYVLSLMNVDPFRQKIGRLDAMPLMSLADLSAEEAQSLTLRSSHGGKAFVRMQGVDLPSYEVDTVSPKVCPACLAERGICEAFWDLEQAHACPLHRIQLQRYCGGCRKSISWSRGSLVHCRCGYRLTALPMMPASESLSELMAVMRHALYGNGGQAPPPPSMLHLKHLGIRKLCKLLWVMTNSLYALRAGLKGSASPKARTVYGEQLERVAGALSDWPHGYQCYLSETYQSLIEAPEGLPNFRRMFGWLLNRLIKNDADGGGDYVFMLEQTFLFGAKFWTRDAMMRSEDDRTLMPSKFRWGTVSDAAGLMNLHMATTKKLIRTGCLRVRRIANGSKMRSVIVDMDSARDLTISKYSAVAVRTAAASLGLSVGLLKQLRENGAFCARHITYPGAYAHEDVEAFSEKIRALGRDKGRSMKGRVTLQQVMCHQDLGVSDKARFAQQILANPHWVVGKVGVGFGALLIEQELADQLLRGGLLGERDCVAIGDAAKRFGCDFVDVTALKRAGHITAREGSARGQICKRSFEDFAGSYEPLRMIARRKRVPIKRVYARVDLSDVDRIVLGKKDCSTVFVALKHSGRVEKRIDAMERAQANGRQARSDDGERHEN